MRQGAYPLIFQGFRAIAPLLQLRKPYVVLHFCLYLMWVLPAWGQTSDTGLLRGRMVDGRTGAPLSDVLVTLEEAPRLSIPVVGYAFMSRTVDAYFVTDVRNTLRLPAYAAARCARESRLQVSTRRLTLFAEVINVLDRSNVRFDPPSVNTVTHAPATRSNV